MTFIPVAHLKINTEFIPSYYFYCRVHNLANYSENNYQIHVKEKMWKQPAIFWHNILWEGNYWVGQKVHLNFPKTSSYGKTQKNFFALSHIWIPVLQKGNGDTEKLTDLSSVLVWGCKLIRFQSSIVQWKRYLVIYLHKNKEESWKEAILGKWRIHFHKLCTRKILPPTTT